MNGVLPYHLRRKPGRAAGLKFWTNTVANVTKTFSWATKSLGLVATLATAYVLGIANFFHVCIWIELRFPGLNYILQFSIQVAEVEKD